MRFSHVQPAPAAPKVLPGEQPDVRFDSGDEACGYRPITAVNARVEAETS